jgi:multidrug efflux pump subunit AcrB
VVTINTVFPGASPEEVNDKVTRVIEDELRGIDGIKDVRSESQSNVSNLTVRVDIDGVDSNKVVSDIQKAVQRASSKLPPEVLENPRVLEVNAKEIPVLELAVVGSNEKRARDILAEKLQDEMEDVKGVSSVRFSGYSERELQVLLNQDKMKALGIGLADIYSSLNSQIKNIPSGYVDNRKEIKLVRVIGKNISSEDLLKVIVRSNDAGQSVRLSDVAKIVDGPKRPSVLARVNGEEATIVITTKKGDADALKTLDQVQAKVDTFQAALPSGYKLVVYNDEGARIKNRLQIVSSNALTGMAIVLIVLFLFLPGKVGLFSSLSLPICAVGTVAMMVYFGANFNIITMIALVICLGNLVDNSVVISEFYTGLREKGVAAREAAIQSANQFWIPFTASTITIISAFIPMLVTKGVFGQFIKWIPIIVAIALTLSLLEALTLLPARLQFLHPKVKKSTDSNWFANFETGFGKMIAFTLRRKYSTMFGLIALVFSGFAVNNMFNRFELFPAEGVEYFVGRFETKPGTSIYETDKFAASLSGEVLKVMNPEVVQSIVARSGISQTDPSDPRSKIGDNVGLILISIKPEKAPDLNVKETVAQLKTIAKPEGVLKMLFEPIENGPPVGRPLTVTLRSSDYGQLDLARKEMLSVLSTSPGVLNLEDDEQSSGTEFLFNPLEEARAFSTLTVDLIGLNLRTALEGSVVANLTESGREYDLVVRYDEGSRNSFTDLKAIEISTPKGNMVPLMSLGKFAEGEAPKNKRSYDFKSSITITSDVDNVNLTSQNANKLAQEKFIEIQKKYPLVNAVFGGEEETTKESLQSLAIALVLALFGIYATLVFTFRSFTQSLLILSTIPLGLVGVFYSFTAVQRPLSFLAFIGVVGLTGVVINSAIILVDYIRELRKEMSNLSLDEVLVLASARRLRAVLATGITTVVGLLPTAFGWGGYDAVLVDITLALSWGMIFGTVLSLVWIPAGFSILTDLNLAVRKGFLKLFPN